MSRSDHSAASDSLGGVADPNTLTGKVMCGYQGWFTCKDDGADLGWTHWAAKKNQDFAPGNVHVDMWPDMREMGDDERYDTGFDHKDGRIAQVFSSANRKTVIRHFQWMQEYGIDGAFLQRFACAINPGTKLCSFKNSVLSHVRKGCKTHGRTYAIMYDLSGLQSGKMSCVKKDMTMLMENAIFEDAMYLHHEGKPVVSVWGVGFGNTRAYGLSECKELIEWLKTTGFTVMVGTPSYWRDGGKDATTNVDELHEILEMADVVSPWSVGRYTSQQMATKHAANVWQSDRRWCMKRGLDFLPVVFPGFSWHNMHSDKPLGSIPRNGGRFMWSQIVGARKAGCDMIYVAMFDEVDEGTAIFKVTNDPPTANGGEFLSYNGLPSDYYLKLTGIAGMVARREIAVGGMTLKDAMDIYSKANPSAFSDDEGDRMCGACM